MGVAMIAGREVLLVWGVAVIAGREVLLVWGMAVIAGREVLPVWGVAMIAGREGVVVLYCKSCMCIRESLLLAHAHTHTSLPGPSPPTSTMQERAGACLPGAAAVQHQCLVQRVRQVLL